MTPNYKYKKALRGGVRACNNLLQLPKKTRCGDWVAEACCMLSLLLAVPFCIYNFWHGVIPTSYFIFNDLSRLGLDCSARRVLVTILYAHAYCGRNGSRDARRRVRYVQLIACSHIATYIAEKLCLILTLNHRGSASSQARSALQCTL